MAIGETKGGRGTPEQPATIEDELEEILLVAATQQPVLSRVRTPVDADLHAFDDSRLTGLPCGVDEQHAPYESELRAVGHGAELG